jgi:hypothetical protein
MKSVGFSRNVSRSRDRLNAKQRSGSIRALVQGADAWYGLANMGGNAVVNLKASKSDRVKGKDVYGKMMTLVRTQPKQLSLFQTFLPENDDKYSNTINLYDAVPKYFPTKHMAGRRESGKYLPILEREFEHRGESFKLKIRPARIQYKDGQEREYYPSYREEIIEEALRKIACDRLNGVYLDDRAGVQFTLYALRKELWARGHALNLPDLLEGLKICNLASLSVQKVDGTAIIQAPIFPVLLVASKDDWLQNPKDARCYVQFNPLVTASIDHLTYRQFDYLTYMSYKHRLSRWLHKRLAHNYIQAGLLSPYTIRMSTILRDSGAYQSKRGNNNAREIDNALEELKIKRVLMKFTKDIVRGPRNRLVDIAYTLQPDMDFINEMKKANARLKRLSV